MNTERLTCADVARRIEAAMPGTLRPYIQIGDGRLWSHCSTFSGNSVVMHEQLAEWALIGAMVMATNARRNTDEWSIPVVPPEDQPWWEDMRTFADSDHANDPLLSLLAAFEFCVAQAKQPQRGGQ